MTQKHHSDHSSLRSKGKDDKDNSFKVTNKFYNATNNWNSFALENTTEKKSDDTKEQRGNLLSSRSSVLLQNSSKNTISRLQAGTKFCKASSTSGMRASLRSSGDLYYLQGSLSTNTGITSNNIDPEDASGTKREKQRRPDCKKSIAAATIVWRRLLSNAPKPQRQTRTTRPSFEESAKKLEGALQSAR